MFKSYSICKWYVTAVSKIHNNRTILLSIETGN